MQLIPETQSTEDININMSMQAESPVSKHMTDIKKGNLATKESNLNIDVGTVAILDIGMSNKTEPVTDCLPLMPSETTNETVLGEEKCPEAVDTLQEEDLLVNISAVNNENTTNGTYCNENGNESETKNSHEKTSAEKLLTITKDIPAETNLASNSDDRSDTADKYENLMAATEHESKLEIHVANKTMNMSDNVAAVLSSEITNGDADVTLQETEFSSKTKDTVEVLNTTNVDDMPDVNKGESKKLATSENIENVNVPVDVVINCDFNTDSDIFMDGEVNEFSKVLEDVAFKEKIEEKLYCETLMNRENSQENDVDEEMAENPEEPCKVPLEKDIAIDNEPHTVNDEKVIIIQNSISTNKEENHDDVTMQEVEEPCFNENSIAVNSVELNSVTMNKDITVATVENTSTADECFSALKENASVELNRLNDRPLPIIEETDISMTKPTALTVKNTTIGDEKEQVNDDVNKDRNTFQNNVESVVSANNNCSETGVVFDQKEVCRMETGDIEIVELDKEKQIKNKSKSESALDCVVGKETDLEITEPIPTAQTSIEKYAIESLTSEDIKIMDVQLKEVEKESMELDDVEIVDLEKDTNKQDENADKTESTSDIINSKDIFVKITEQQAISEKVVNIEKHINVRTDLMNENSKNENTSEAVLVNTIEKPITTIKKILSLEDQNKVEIFDEDDIKIVENNSEEIQSKTQEKEKSPEPKVTKMLPVVCKLSNTLDILSDDEEEPSKALTNDTENSATEKQYINIDDDDDIMLIEEDSNSKEATNESKTEVLNDKEELQPKPNDKRDLETGEQNIPITDIMESAPANNDSSINTPVLDVDAVPQTVNINEGKGEKPETKNPLLSKNFLKTAKKNLADMTRHELEDFCILRIVESIVDRSNLSDIKTKMKTMAQNLEDFRKRALLLTKQNRDLQVVLKSVQEEQKKRTNTPIQPLKITRSVGMQVLMNDKLDSRRKGPIPNQTSTVPVSRPVRAVQSTKITKLPGNPPTIPVPRKVPVNNSPAKIVTTAPANNTGNKIASPNPNGMRNPSPVQKVPEKRTHSRMQSSSSSVTVDLTDDEPPSKINNKNAPVPPVRVVPPQNLLAQQRPFAQPLNSPRKVYIPISGPQAQTIRPGQTLMMRGLPPGPRQRQPVPRTQQSPIRINKQVTHRHPAPLPDAMKQYTPPTWKALPPAPDLKLSKVENGIVISWKIDAAESGYETIASYQLYAYQETTAPPSTALWKKIGDVKALPLPMACTLTQFMAGFKYYFAVRAVDIRSRLGPFSLPGSILLLNKV